MMFLDVDFFGCTLLGHWAFRMWVNCFHQNWKDFSHYFFKYIFSLIFLFLLLKLQKHKFQIFYYGFISLWYQFIFKIYFFYITFRLHNLLFIYTTFSWLFSLLLLFYYSFHEIFILVIAFFSLKFFIWFFFLLYLFFSILCVWICFKGYLLLFVHFSYDCCEMFVR